MVARYVPPEQLEEREYRRRIRAWTLYDWANSAFVTTVSAAVLPVYYSTVACATLPDVTAATAYWSIGLSISLLIVAVLSPILGAISDVAGTKKLFLGGFAAAGIIGTTLLVLVSTGDWMLASVLVVLGRIGLSGSLVFYDALLPHVARPADRDTVSARGYATGYLGGGILLAVNVAMIMGLPGTWGSRLSFLSVAIWWALFSIPLFRTVPEPPAVGAPPGAGAIAAGFKTLAARLRDVRRFRQLFRFLIAYLIYNDGIGTIIGLAAIYGSELGLGAVELILALLLVQFVGIPFSLIFGRIASPRERRRPVFLAFVLFNMAALPLAGILGTAFTSPSVAGTRPPAFEAKPGFVGEGVYKAADPAVESFAGGGTAEARVRLRFHGQAVKILHGTGPDQGIVRVLVDGESVIDADTGKPVAIDAQSPAPRYRATTTVTARAPGDHVLELIAKGSAAGASFPLESFEVLPPARRSDLVAIVAILIGVQAVGAAFALAAGRRLFARIAEGFDTKRGIMLALACYTIIAAWGFFLDSTLEFWFLAWLVATVQGGSQALSRSLYARMSPATKSGEFFGLFGIMDKFSTFLGPLAFASVGLALGSSRPAVLSLILFFAVGMAILASVDVEEGGRVAAEEDAAAHRRGGGGSAEPAP